MTDSIETSEDEALPWVPPVDADDVHAMTYKLPPMPKNLPNVVRRIRACEGDVAAQVVFEHALNEYAIAAMEAQGVPDGWQLVRTDALKMAVGFAVPAMERDRDSPSNSAWMVEVAERNINAVRAMLASAPPAPQAEPAGACATCGALQDDQIIKQASAEQQEPVGDIKIKGGAA